MTGISSGCIEAQEPFCTRFAGGSRSLHRPEREALLRAGVSQGMSDENSKTGRSQDPPSGPGVSRTGVNPSVERAHHEEPRLLERVRRALRIRHYSPRTEKAYVRWIIRFIFFHGKRHPEEMGPKEVERFLSHLATVGRVGASTQNQALSALLFLYREVVGRELGLMSNLVWAKRPVRLPLVLSREEVAAILSRLHGTPWLMVSLLYGAGLRLLECCRLRVKDVDLARNEITVRDGKRRKDRVTLLPAKLKEPLACHIERRRRLHQEDLKRGAGSVELPDALKVKYPSAPRKWPWQWIFPATRPRAREPLAARSVSSPSIRSLILDQLKDYDLRGFSTASLARERAGLRRWS